MSKPNDSADNCGSSHCSSCRDPETFSRCGFPFPTFADRESHEDACYVCWVFRTANQFSCLRGCECVEKLGHAALVQNRGDVCEWCRSGMK
jgi:hypothetical protein